MYQRVYQCTKCLSPPGRVCHLLALAVDSEVLCKHNWNSCLSEGFKLLNPGFRNKFRKYRNRKLRKFGKG